MSPRLIRFLALTSALVVASCGDRAPASNAHGKELAALTAAVESLTESNEDVQRELTLQGRQIEALRRRGGRSERPATAASGMSETEPGAASAAPASHAASTEVAEPDAVVVTEESMDALLATDAGKAAMKKAAATEVARREQQDRRTFVAYTIGVFANEIGLDDHQTRELQGIWKDSMDSGVELRKNFRALAKMPEAERKTKRAEVMQEMRDIGTRRTERVRELLSGEQLDLYEKKDTEIVAGLHGGSR